MTAKDKKPAKKTGRPSIYSEELAAKICQRLTEGESLRSICLDEAMPAMSTVFVWLKQDKVFVEQYARARDIQADYLAESIVDIADEEIATIKRGEGDEEVIAFDSTAVARNRLRVDARKWYASKLAPKKYGDRQHVEMEVTDVTPLADRMKQARERAKGK